MAAGAVAMGIRNISGLFAEMAQTEQYNVFIGGRKVRGMAMAL